MIISRAKYLFLIACISCLTVMGARWIDGKEEVSPISAAQAEESKAPKKEAGSEGKEQTKEKGEGKSAEGERDKDAKESKDSSKNSSKDSKDAKDGKEAAGEKGKSEETGEKASAQKAVYTGSSNCLANPAAIEDMQAQREKLQAKQKELDAKEAELKAMERALNDEMAKLDEARKDIAKTDNLRKKENEEKITKLVETLEAMSPKAASQVVASLDEALAVVAISRMSTPKLAKVMNLLEPGKSTRLTEALAGLSRAKAVKVTASNGVAGASTTTKGGEKKYEHREQPNNSVNGGKSGESGREPAAAEKPAKSG